MSAHISRLRRTVLGAGLSAAVLSLTGCGGGDSEPTTNEKGLIELKVAVSPGAATSTPLYLALENGVFEERGLDLELSVLEDGSVAVPQVLNGQTQFSMSSFGPAAQAIEKGIAVKLIGGANVIPEGQDSKYQAVIVNRDAGIDDMSEVETWAADTTEVDPSHAYTVDQMGGDYESIKRVAVPFPSIGDAVADGTVHAALVNEPFLSAALETGDAEVLEYVTGDLTVPGAPGAVFIGAEEYMSENPELTQDFIEGVQEAYEYAQANMEEVAKFVPQTGLNDQVPPVVALGQYQEGPLQPEAVQSLLDIFSEYGAIEGTVQAEEMIHQP